MRKKYQYRFKFVDTEEEAKEFCEAQNRQATRYMRKNHPAHYTPWNSRDEYKFVCWYYW